MPISLICVNTFTQTSLYIRYTHNFLVATLVLTHYFRYAKPRMGRNGRLFCIAILAMVKLYQPTASALTNFCHVEPKSGKREVQYFDFISASSGQHQNPFMPTDDEPWKNYKGEITHSHYYKYPTADMAQKSVCIVGGLFLFYSFLFYVF